MATMKFTLEGPRWAGISEFVRDYCFSHDIKLDMDVQTGWFKEKCYVKMEGTNAQVLAAERDIKASVNQYNA